MEQTRHDLTSQLDTTKEELSSKSQQLTDLTSDLAAARTKATEVESRLAELTSQLESAESANQEMVESKAALEDLLEQEKAAIRAERKSLEEKCTFLHFTQEQLNSQVNFGVDEGNVLAQTFLNNTRFY